MTRQTLIVVVVTTAVVVATSGTALAKGPESATITGPGIDEPIELINADYFNSDYTNHVKELMRQTGLWYATSSRISAKPAGDLGPRYTLTWINSGPPGGPVEERTIRQALYLYAENGPVIHTPAQEGLEGWGPDVVGWFTPPDGLSDTLAALDVPILESGSFGEPLASAIPGGASVERDPVSVPEVTGDTSASDAATANAAVKGEPAEDFRYLVALGLGLIILLTFAAWRRMVISAR